MSIQTINLKITSINSARPVQKGTLIRYHSSNTMHDMISVVGYITTLTLTGSRLSSVSC